jgi:hypothetical protein
MSWSAAFDEPIPVKGRTLFTLNCAARYIGKLSNAEQESQYWQIAIEPTCRRRGGTRFRQER